jgi:hypothetical protein
MFSEYFCATSPIPWWHGEKLNHIKENFPLASEHIVWDKFGNKHYIFASICACFDENEKDIRKDFYPFSPIYKI